MKAFSFFNSATGTLFVDGTAVAEESQDRQGTRPHRAVDAARPRRRGDRMRQRTNDESKCQTGPMFDTFSARSADFAGLFFDANNSRRFIRSPRRRARATDSRSVGVCIMRPAPP